MTFLMIVTMMPMNVFAEVDSSNPDNWANPTPIQSPGGTSTRAVDTPDWEVSDEEAEADHWPLTANNRLVEAANADSIKNPNIEYGGTFNLGDRQVITILYKTQSSANAVWQRLLLKFDKTLAQMIDWDNAKTGAWKDPAKNRESTNPQHFDGKIIKFTSEPRENAGSDNVYSVALNDAMFKKQAIEAPMHFVLKSPDQLQQQGLPTSVEALVQSKEPVIQSRIVDKYYEKVRMNPCAHLDGYSTYTSSTIIPRRDYRAGLIPECEDDNIDPWILTQTAFLTYNKNKGYVDLTIRHNKNANKPLQDKKVLGLRTVIEDKFFNVLAGSAEEGVPEDGSAKIADVFIVGADEKPYDGGSYDNPVTKRRIPVLRNQINQGQDGLQYIQVLGTDYQKTAYENNIKTQSTGNALETLVNSALASGGRGVGTIVRFYVKPQKFESLISDTDLLDMTFYTTFTTQTKAGEARETFSGKVDKDRTLRKGQKLVLDVGTKEFSGGSFAGNRKMVMEVGERPHNVVFQSAQNATLQTSLYWKDSTSYWWTIPYDMTLKAGTPIKIYMQGLKKDIREVRFYTSKDEQALGDGGDFFTITKDPDKCGDMQYVRFAGNLKSPNIEKTQNEASIPEIFTTDTILYGHTKIGNAIVRARGVSEDEKSVLNQAYLSDANDTYKDVGSGDDAESVIDKKRSQAVIVNKKIYNGYEFSTQTAVNPSDPLGATAGILNKKYKMVKDAPLAFSTEDYSINAIEKLPPVIEQVQAKVNFDLNGGYLGEDQNAEKAKDPIIKIAPLNENYRYVVDKDNFPTATLNPAYKANAFEGANRRMVDDGTGNQVMASHTDQPLGTEIYQVAFDNYKAQLQAKLEEAQALPTGVGTPNAIRNAAIAEAQKDIASFNNYIAKFYTNKGIDITKSQLWLREFPGKESQVGLKTENPKMDNKEFYGWTTKKVNKVDEYNKLQELKTEDQAKDTVKTYKFTENSPILSEMTVYAFYGPVKSQVTNPVQTYDEDNDKQYIEIIPAEEGKPLPTDATYKLVKKNEDGTYTEVEGLTQTTKEDGTPVFDITNIPSDKFDPEADYCIETTELGKTPSYSDAPIKIDKVGPTFTNDSEGNAVTLIQDHFGYQVKVSANASDDAGILRVYAETDKDNGYYKADASEITANLSESIQEQGGVEKTFTVTAVDKFGNKNTATGTVEPKAEPLSLKAERPLGDTDFIYVTTTAGANLEIKVINADKSVALTMTHTQEEASEEIKLVKDGAPFTLTKGQKIKITATSGDQTAKLTIRVR